MEDIDTLQQTHRVEALQQHQKVTVVSSIISPDTPHRRSSKTSSTMIRQNGNTIASREVINLLSDDEYDNNDSDESSIIVYDQKDLDVMTTLPRKSLGKEFDEQQQQVESQVVIVTASARNRHIVSSPLRTTHCKDKSVYDTPPRSRASTGLDTSATELSGMLPVSMARITTSPCRSVISPPNVNKKYLMPMNELKKNLQSKNTISDSTNPNGCKVRMEMIDGGAVGATLVSSVPPSTAVAGYHSQEIKRTARKTITAQEHEIDTIVRAAMDDDTPIVQQNASSTATTTNNAMEIATRDSSSTTAVAANVMTVESSLSKQVQCTTTNTVSSVSTSVIEPKSTNDRQQRQKSLDQKQQQHQPNLYFPLSTANYNNCIDLNNKCSNMSNHNPQKTLEEQQQRTRFFKTVRPQRRDISTATSLVSPLHPSIEIYQPPDRSNGTVPNRSTHLQQQQQQQTALSTHCIVQPPDDYPQLRSEQLDVIALPTCKTQRPHTGSQVSKIRHSVEAKQPPETNSLSNGKTSTNDNHNIESGATTHVRNHYPTNAQKHKQTTKGSAIATTSTPKLPLPSDKIIVNGHAMSIAASRQNGLKLPPNSNKDTVSNRTYQSTTSNISDVAENKRRTPTTTATATLLPHLSVGSITVSVSNQQKTVASLARRPDHTGHNNIMPDAVGSSRVLPLDTVATVSATVNTKKRGRPNKRSAVASSQTKLMVYFHEKYRDSINAFRKVVDSFRLEYQSLPYNCDRKNVIISTIANQFEFERNDPKYIQGKIKKALLRTSFYFNESRSDDRFVKDNSTPASRTRSDLKRWNKSTPASVSTGNKVLKRRRNSNNNDEFTTKQPIEVERRKQCTPIRDPPLLTNDADVHDPFPSVNDEEYMKRWRDVILPCLQYCGNCTQCQVTPCNECRLCTFIPVASVHRQRKSATECGPENKRLKTSRRYCLLNCCSTCDDDLTKKFTHANKRTSITSGSLTNTRINHLCDRLKVYQWYRHAISYEIKKVEAKRGIEQSTNHFQFDLNTPVYCFWPQSNTYFEASVVKRYFSNRGICVPLYSVHFTDGSDDARRSVPERDILTTFQMLFLMEADRIEDKLKECTSLSEYMFPDGPCEKRGVPGREVTLKIPAATSDEVEASLDGTLSIDGDASLSDTSVSSQISPDHSLLPELLEVSTDSDQRRLESDCNIMQNNHEMNQSASSQSECQKSITQGDQSVTNSLSPVSHELILPEVVQSNSQANATEANTKRFKKREYSSFKRVGSRCYARWPEDKSYFWGFITKTFGSGAYRRYSVRFDDGDCCDNIPPEHLYSELEYRRIERKEPPNVIGQNSVIVQSHPLYNMGFCRKWIDLSGSVRTTFGQIRDCIESYDGPSALLFDVHYYDDKNGGVLHEVSSQMKVDQLLEHVAWGGHLTYLAEVEPNSTIPRNLPFHVKWMVPSRRYFDSIGQLFMETNGFRLQMTAEESNIPGAGLGLFLRIFDMSGKDRPHFVLSQGELLCLGPYGPLLANDRKSIAVFDAKSFIYEYEPESYCFEATHENKSIYVDITSDQDGQLHDLAKTNLMCRVNEVDAWDIPCVCADRDPSGSIQYYLGHNVASFGILKIPVDNPFELKIDYGELYERQRVRFGYPRVQGEKLADMKKSIATLDEDQIKDLSEYSPNDIHECLLFLESLFCPVWVATELMKQRALVLAIAFHHRITHLPKMSNVPDVDNSFLDGHEDIERHCTISRALKMIKTLCDSVGGSQEIQRVVLSHDLLFKYVAKHIFYADFTSNSVHVKSISTDSLYRRIISGTNPI